MIARRALGIAGLLVFEIVALVATLNAGGTPFWPIPIAAIVCLGTALALALRGDRVPTWALWIYAIALAGRAYRQLPASDLFTLAITLAMPASAAIVASGASMRSDAVARTGLWGIGALRVLFAFLFFTSGAPLFGIANVIGAAGAALWALDREPEGSMTDADVAATAR